MLSTIGVIGDIHAESERLRASLLYLQQINLDATICTGDIVDGRGSVDECVQLLQEFDVKTVLGNHDAWFLKNSMRGLPDSTKASDVNENTWHFLSGLPIEREFETKAGRLLVCHGLGRHLMAKVGEDDYGYALDNNFELQDLIESRRWRFVVNGHTHRQMTRDFSELTVINAGSLLYDYPCFQTINFSTGLITVFSPDDPAQNSVSMKIPGL